MWLVTGLTPHYAIKGTWISNWELAAGRARWWLTDGAASAELVPWGAAFLTGGASNYFVWGAGAAAPGNVVQAPVVITSRLWLRAENETGSAQGFAYTGTCCQ